MFQTTSILSTLGAQTQTRSAVSALQASPGSVTPSLPQTGLGLQTAESLDPNGSLFQLMLSFMLSSTGSQTSASVLQAPAEGGTAQETVKNP